MPVNLPRLLPDRLPLGVSGPFRIAQLTSAGGFAGTKSFPPSRWSELTAFAPEILAGSATDLQRLVERRDLGTLKIDSVDHSIWVLTDLGDRPLMNRLRVVLWQRFGVPVYEVLTEGRGCVLAYECENHDGLHVVSGARFAILHGELVWQTASGAPVRTGLARRLDSIPCPCGRAGVRIVQHANEPFPATEEEPLLAAIA